MNALVAGALISVTLVSYRGGSRAATTSKMERFVTKRSILEVAAVLDPPLSYCWMF